MPKEKLDVYDENKKSLNISKLRDKVHKEGHFHKSVHVWIINSKNEILIQKRSSDRKVSPGFWTISASGHVESGQKDIETAKRETEEELGLKFNLEDFEYFKTYKKTKEYPKRNIKDNEFNPIFVVKKDIDTKKLNIDENEVEKVKLIHYKELRKLIKENKIKFRPDRKKYHKILFNYFK